MKNYIEHNGKTIKTEIYYNIGGYGKKRGYYLSVQPIERTEHKTADGSAYFIETFTAFTGYYYLLFEVPRQSKKHEENANKQAGEVLPQILERFN